MNQSGGWVLELLHQYGYAGLAMVLFLTCLLLPIPSEAVLVLAGVLVRSGGLDWWTVLMVAFWSQLAGPVVAYLLARYGGINLLERYGQYVHVRPRQLLRLQRLFGHHGPLLVLLVICMPGIHGYVGYPAGLAKMNFGVFFGLSVVGMAVWTVMLVGLGVLLADHVDGLVAALSGVGGMMVIGVVLLVAFGIWYSKRHVRRRT